LQGIRLTLDINQDRGVHTVMFRQSNSSSSVFFSIPLFPSFPSPPIPQPSSFVPFSPEKLT
jgi:hypothetical protein